MAWRERPLVEPLKRERRTVSDRLEKAAMDFDLNKAIQYFQDVRHQAYTESSGTGGAPGLLDSTYVVYVATRPSTSRSYKRADRLRWQALAQLPVYVAEWMARAGYGTLRGFSPDQGYRFTVEHSIYVARSAQRRGIGSCSPARA